MSLSERVESAAAVFFDLFHTIFSFGSDGTKGTDTSELLGIPDEIWQQLVFNESDARLRGIQTDKYEIIGCLAHMHDPHIPEDAIRSAADYREERFAQGLANPGPERIAELRKLKARGKKLGLISNADCIESAGWINSPFYEVFDTTVFSYQVGYVKPDVEIYQEAMRRLEVAPEESVFVGDGSNSEHDGARRAGMCTVLTTEIIKSRWPEKIEARKQGVDYVIDSLSELNRVPNSRLTQPEQSDA